MVIMASTQRRPYIIDRRLFGPHICRIGGCGRDGTHGVALPGTLMLTNEPVWTTVYFCEKHVAEHVARGNRATRKRSNRKQEKP